MHQSCGQWLVVVHGRKAAQYVSQLIVQLVVVAVVQLSKSTSFRRWSARTCRSRCSWHIATSVILLLLNVLVCDVCWTADVHLNRCCFCLCHVVMKKVGVVKKNVWCGVVVNATVVLKKNVAVVMDELSLMVLVVDLLLVVDVKVCLPRPRSSRRSNLLAASLKAVRPFLEGTQSSKPNAARRRSDVTNVVVAPDRIHACFPTC